MTQLWSFAVSNPVAGALFGAVVIAAVILVVGAIASVIHGRGLFTPDDGGLVAVDGVPFGANGPKTGTSDGCPVAKQLSQSAVVTPPSALPSQARSASAGRPAREAERPGGLRGT